MCTGDGRLPRGESRRRWRAGNGFTIAAIVRLACTYRAFPLSRISYMLIFLFLCLRTAGGLAPQQLDRLVHFCYGSFLARRACGNPG